MLKRDFPGVKLIENRENVGFSKANNQAIKESTGQYVLLLNPDTVVAEDTFEKVVAFMDEHPDCGGLGVRMIDGVGQFLPESKRGLPTPWVAFYKIFGLTSLFPTSRKFGQYHQGHLPEHEINPTEVLSGAFMLMRAEALEKVGLLDEDYFMYGEDIDLSYRITQGGYKNYYFPETTIIHYKGESTKKSSVNYVVIFYRAMVIFARKHFSGKSASLSSFLINFAIYLRAFMAILSRFVKRSFLPFMDALYLVTGLYALTNYWQKAGIDFPDDLIRYSIPMYAGTWLISSFVNGGYDFPFKLAKYTKGVLMGTILILVAYAILPKDYQFSRLFIFVGAGWTLIYYLLSRLFFHVAFKGRFRLFRKKKSFSVIASNEELERIKGLIRKTQPNAGAILQGSSGQLHQIDADELIFASKNYSFGQIIKWMSYASGRGIEFKIAPPDKLLLIGSNSIDTAGELYTLNLNALNSDENKRKKRLFDFVIASGFLIASPLLFFLYKSPPSLYRNLGNIWIGKRSFIGYTDIEMKQDVRLPKIREGIFSPADALEGADKALREKLNLLYSHDYSMRKDFSIVRKLWRNLDR